MIYVVRSNTGQFYRRGKLVQSCAAASCGHSPSSVRPILARARATFPELQWEAVPFREAVGIAELDASRVVEQVTHHKQAHEESLASRGVREAVIVQCYGCGEGVAEGMACRRKRGATRPPDCKASPPRDGDPDTYGVPEAQPQQPVAWVRCHPDGTLTGELLLDSRIEQVRKDSGAWVPLVRAAGVKGRRQYYYMTIGCKATDSTDPACTCWHDEGGGPVPKMDPKLLEWRDAPADVPVVAGADVQQDGIHVGVEAVHVSVALWSYEYEHMDGGWFTKWSDCEPTGDGVRNVRKWSATPAAGVEGTSK